jgi:hypothetical protein
MVQQNFAQKVASLMVCYPFSVKLGKIKGRRSCFSQEGGWSMSKARAAIPTVTFIDEYCQLYQDLFPDVRSFEHFKFLHVGMLSEIKRKTLPAIAKVGGDLDPQALHHFVANARLLCRRAAYQAADALTQGAEWKAVRAVHR